MGCCCGREEDERDQELEGLNKQHEDKHAKAPPSLLLTHLDLRSTQLCW